ncbi:MAG: O-methyltransferase [Acholeplasmatales bacterium]|nr:O-methyltransferase [Acholeplasmatales bacterium]
MIVKETNTINFNEKIESMRSFARENGVPIIKDEGLVFLKNIIGLKRPMNILEIGTAIGYSALMMNSVCNSNIYTIERDEKMYNEATKNINELGVKNINIIYKDALEAVDLIFIDAAKAQYKKFFDIYTPLLNKNGVVVCDNMLFHGVVVHEENYDNLTKGLRGLVRKLHAFTKELMENDKYDTTLYDIGDGISVSILK